MALALAAMMARPCRRSGRCWACGKIRRRHAPARGSFWRRHRTLPCRSPARPSGSRQSGSGSASTSGSWMIATRIRLGAIRLMISGHCVLAPNSVRHNPVTPPPGRSSAVTRPGSHRIDDVEKHHRHAAARRQQRLCRIAIGADQELGRQLSQIGRVIPDAAVVVARPADFDLEIAAFDPALGLEPLGQRFETLLRPAVATLRVHQHADAPHALRRQRHVRLRLGCRRCRRRMGAQRQFGSFRRGMLCVGPQKTGKRHRCRAAQELYELTPPHLDRLNAAAASNRLAECTSSAGRPS